jgi:hypothetical protein
VRVKVTLPASGWERDSPIFGHLVTVTDADTGDYLPMTDLALRVPADGPITVTGTLIVAELEVAE